MTVYNECDLEAVQNIYVLNSNVQWVKGMMLKHSIIHQSWNRDQ